MEQDRHRRVQCMWWLVFPTISWLILEHLLCEVSAAAYEENPDTEINQRAHNAGPRGCGGPGRGLLVQPGNKPPDESRGERGNGLNADPETEHLEQDIRELF